MTDFLKKEEVAGAEMKCGAAGAVQIGNDGRGTAGDCREGRESISESGFGLFTKSLVNSGRRKRLFLGACAAVFMAVAVVSLFYGCKKDGTSNTKYPTIGSTFTQGSDPWEGTKASIHPYSLQNIRVAKTELEMNDQITSDKIFQYVCFFINDDKERDDVNGFIESLNNNIMDEENHIRLFNIPLADPMLYDDQFHDHWYEERDTLQTMQYAIIPVDAIIPYTVNYIFLDTLYFPDLPNEEDLDIGAHILAGIIEVDSLDVEIYYDENNRGLVSWLKKAVTFVKNTVVGTYPSGHVLMNGDGMCGTTVEVIAWGLPHKATTNSSGYFQISTRIHVGTIVYLSFNNSHCNIKLWNLETWYNINNITLTALYYVGGRTAADLSGMMINLDNQSYGGFCATIANGVEKYRQLASQMGIGVPPKVYITALWGKDFSNLGGGCAPMANYILVSPNFVSDFLQPLLQTVTNLSIPFAKLLPDIIIPAQKGFNHKTILGITLHEYTHAAHAHHAGKSFWLNVVSGEIMNMIIDNDPYGYKNTSATEVGVAEAWANSVKYYMMYLLTNDASYINSIENHYTNPTDASAISDWIPSGLYFDLWDDNGSTYNGIIVIEDPKKGIMDEVSGITWGSMYNNLLGTNNFITYKNKLQQQYPTQRQAIEYLFKSYSF